MMSNLLLSSVVGLETVCVHVSVTFFALVRSIAPFRTVDTLFVYACMGIHDDVIRTRDTTRGKLQGNLGGVGWLSILCQPFADEMFDKLGVCHIALIQVGKIHPQLVTAILSNA